MELSMHKWIHSEEVLELLNDLMKMDPVHSCYYNDVISSLLVEHLTSNRESLMKHCGYCSETSSSFHQNVYLDLNKLSLSRIGFVERFQWVQMLDLSQNELRSIEGLETMQLLVCLNNRLSSFTALERLRLLKSLKVLDPTTRLAHVLSTLGGIHAHLLYLTQWEVTGTSKTVQQMTSNRLTAGKLYRFSKSFI